MYRKFSKSSAIAAASLTLAGGLALPSQAQAVPDAAATQNFLGSLSSILQGQNPVAHQLAVGVLGEQYNLQAAGLVCSALSQGTGVEAVLNNLNR